MTVTLEVLNTNANVRRVELTRSAVIGRGRDCGLRVASHRVSRRHCEIMIDKDAIRVRDLQSKNGTFVNDKPLIPGVVFEIDPDDELRLGSVRFRVMFEPIVVERPVLKKPTMDIPKGSLMGAIAAAAGEVVADDEDLPAPKVDLTQEAFQIEPAAVAEDAAEESSGDDAAVDEPVPDDPGSFENLETVDAFEMPSTDDDADAPGDSDDDDAMAFLNDEEPASDGEEEDVVAPSFEVGNEDDNLDDSAILDFLSNMD